MTNKEFNKAKQLANTKKMSEAANWMLSKKGLEFRRGSQVISKWYVYRWKKLTGLDPADFFNITQKPGWENGVLKFQKAHEDYLKNVIFAI